MKNSLKKFVTVVVFFVGCFAITATHAQVFRAIVLQPNLTVNFPAGTVINFPSNAAFDVSGSGLQVHLPGNGSLVAEIPVGTKIEFPNESNPPFPLGDSTGLTVGFPGSTTIEFPSDKVVEIPGQVRRVKLRQSVLVNLPRSGKYSRR